MDLAINLKTAMAPGLNIPGNLFAPASKYPDELGDSRNGRSWPGR
jgi:hypothetical protein